MQVNNEFQIDLLNKVLDTTSEALIVTNENNEIIKINKACENITGYLQEEVLGKNPKIFSSNKTSLETFEKIWKTLQTNDFWIGELLNRHKDGLIYPIIIKIYRLKDPISKKINYYAIFSDISSSNESPNELFNLTHSDSLTNLPNKLKLRAQLEYVINDSKRNNLKFAVLFLDVDDFKKVNDELGYSCGDSLLTSLSLKLKNIIRSTDIIARVGADKFVIILTEIKDYMFVKRVCNNINDLTKNSITINEKTLNIGISMGISIYPDNCVDLDELIDTAEKAMTQVKLNGKNHFEFFSSEMNLKLFKSTQKEQQLIDAIKNDEFVIHFQPQIDTNTNSVFSLEILARWNNIREGLLKPGVFLNDLEFANLILDFEKLILDKASKQLKYWHLKEFYNGKISVNISGQHLKSGNLYENVVEILKRNLLEPTFLELEFNEKDIIGIDEVNLEMLNKLASLGITLTIDNFGREFTSFNHLKNCSISKLKINKSYIDSLSNENSDEDIIKSIIDLGENMNISVVAEGVELPNQDKILKKDQCSKVQGYYYAMPMNNTYFEDWYKKRLNY